ASDQIRLHRAEHRFGRLPATAHFAEADQPFVGFKLDNRPHKAPPVAPIRMTQRRLERNGHGGGFDVGDLHRKNRFIDSLIHWSTLSILSTLSTKSKSCPVIDPTGSSPCPHPDSSPPAQPLWAAAASKTSGSRANMRHAKRSRRAPVSRAFSRPPHNVRRRWLPSTSPTACGSLSPSPRRADNAAPFHPKASAPIAGDGPTAHDETKAETSRGTNADSQTAHAPAPDIASRYCFRLGSGQTPRPAHPLYENRQGSSLRAFPCPTRAPVRNDERPKK